MTLTRLQGRQPDHACPDLVGDQQEVAESQLRSSKLIPNVDTRDADEPEGTVIDQDPAAGSQLRARRHGDDRRLERRRLGRRPRRRRPDRGLGAARTSPAAGSASTWSSRTPPTQRGRPRARAGAAAGLAGPQRRPGDDRRRRVHRARADDHDGPPRRLDDTTTHDDHDRRDADEGGRDLAAGAPPSTRSRCAPAPRSPPGLRAAGHEVVEVLIDARRALDRRRRRGRDAPRRRAARLRRRVPGPARPVRRGRQRPGPARDRSTSPTPAPACSPPRWRWTSWSASGCSPSGACRRSSSARSASPAGASTRRRCPARCG